MTLVNRIRSLFKDDVVSTASNNAAAQFRNMIRAVTLSQQSGSVNSENQVFSYSKIKVIIPALNEKENIYNMINQLRQIGFCEILVVDGHSKDGTAECAQNLGAKVMVQNGNGKGSALREAFKECLDSDVVVMMDADGSMPPEELPSFIDAINSGADVVKGSRFLPPGKSDDFTLTRRAGNKVMTKFANFLFLTQYTDMCYGYMAFNRKALLQLIPCLNGQKFEIETEICVKAKILGLRVMEVPSHERLRRFGSSNLHAFKDGFSILKVLIKEALLS